MESRKWKERRQVKEEKRGKARKREKRRRKSVDGMTADCRVKLGQYCPQRGPLQGTVGRRRWQT
jgi:hypothetical protein